MGVKTEVYGLLAEFPSPEALRDAAERARDEGYSQMDAYTPFPVEGLAKALGKERTFIAPIMLAGGVLGGLGAYALQYYAMAMDYPLNVGGRPLHSWPAFVPVTFELTILSAAIAGFIALLFQNGLPRLHHPVFHIERFERASIDAFFLCIEAADSKYGDGSDTRRFLESVGAREIWEVRD